MWPRCMATEAAQGDLENILGRHDGARTDLEMSHWHTRPVVDTVYLVERKPAHQTIIKHGEGAAAPLLRRLEHEADRAVKTAFVRQHSGSPEQHGGMPVMPAGMHDAVGL